ncbi:hypothetical protein IJ21_18060 [Paenibacillus sp. 32O-W]|uniref:hypothetical protein n=1 Tax=Paenibacillus sp. 32O-W TaxID=1695218 RepID=UPI00072109DF|nr:hypothetical protein [Paenibacillus sp. 32O-W]ALS27207.1 hypothetical protein IJ21_18060 [Paenibacillus sp. 32O-W]
MMPNKPILKSDNGRIVVGCMKPPEEEIAGLNEQVASLLIDSAAKDVQIQQQDAIIADLMLQVAALQTASGGGGA